MLFQWCIFSCNIVYYNQLYFVATSSIAPDYIWLQQHLWQWLYLVATKFIATIVLDVILFIATTYFGLQYILLPQTIRVAIEAITMPLVVATIEYVCGKIWLLPHQWSWQLMTMFVAIDTIATLTLSLHLMSTATSKLMAITRPIATHHFWHP
jgi:hypothetical protein